MLPPGPGALPASTPSPCQLHRARMTTGCTDRDSTGSLEATRMTGTDLIVLAPWIAFAVGLAVICLLLLRSRRTSGPRPQRSPAAPTPAGPPVRRTGPAAGLNPQESRCPEKNAQGQAAMTCEPAARNSRPALAGAARGPVAGPRAGDHRTVAGLPRRGRGRPGGTGDGDAHPEAQALLRRTVAARRKLADVEDALGRLAAGSFGSCEQCGSAIPASLLATAPETRYCPRCDAGPVRVRAAAGRLPR